MRSGLSLALAYRHVRAGLGRMVLSVAAVALGVALVVAIRLMNGAVLASFLDTVDAAAGRAALTVTAGEGLTFPESVADQVAAVPGVALAVPLVTGVAFPDDGSGDLLTVYGVDLTHEADVRLYRGTAENGPVLDDPIVFLSQPDSILLGRAFAASRGLQPGQPLVLAAPRGLKRFTVRGLLDPQGLAQTLGGRLVVMDLYAAERAFTADGQITQVDVVPAADAGLEAVKAAVAAMLPEGLTVAEPALRKDVIRKTIGGFQAMLTAFGLLAVLAGFVICYSRLGAIFEARTWEVGLLRAVGLRRSVVFFELLKESLLLGAAGTVLGLPLGVVIGWHALPFMATATAINFHLPVPETQPAAASGGIAFGIVVGLMAATLAAGIPALRLARKQPVAALTMRGREAPASSSKLAAAVAPCLLIIIAVLVAWQQVSHLTALGNVTTGLVALAACALARPLVVHGGRLLTPPWQRLFGQPGRFAARHLGQHARRAGLTVATLGLGLGVTLMFGMLGWSFERTVVSQLSARFQADIVVTSAFLSGGWMNAPLSDRLVDEIATTTGVRLAAGQQLTDAEYRKKAIALFSYDPICFRDRRVCGWPLAPGSVPSALESVARGDAVLVAASFAFQNGVAPGDRIELESPHGSQSFLVAAVVAEEPANAIIMSRARYRELWNDAQVRWIHVVLDDRADSALVRAALARRFGEEHRLQVRSVRELLDYFGSQTRKAFSVLYLMEGIIFLLVLIGIGDTLATSVIERTHEFGMMRAIGLYRSRLVGMVVLEGLGIGLLGLLLAAATGLLLGLFWVRVQFPAILGWRLDLHFPSRFAIGAVVLTLTLCLVGAVLPSLRAARLSVSEALRNE